MRDIPRAHTKLMLKCLLDYVLSAVVGPCTHGRSSGLGIEWGRTEWPDVINSGLGTVLRHCPMKEMPYQMHSDIQSWAALCLQLSAIFVPPFYCNTHDHDVLIPEQ